MRRLEGKTAVVTGGGTHGIGRAAAARLVAEGAHVFITGRRTDLLDDAAAVIGEGVTAVPGDISRPGGLDAVYDAVRARGKGLDVLFANAGTAGFATVDQTTDEHYAQIFDVNVRGTIRTVREALPLLNEGASVILNASTAADNGTAAFGAYAASKAAVRSFARTWAKELTGRGIRVNAISAGPIDTSGVTELVGEENATAFKAGQGAGIAIGRMGSPAEVAGAVAFLASSDSSFIIGSNLYVDGGENQI